MINHVIRFGPDVEAARAEGAPIVALESTIISHGLPRPANLTVAKEIEATVRAAGAVPATIGMIGGEIVVGLRDDEIAHLAASDDVVKLSVRDLAPAAAAGADGATTVAATSAIAARAGIAVFATGGLGGVHRGASSTFDESADLTALSRLPIAIVCAGVKSILDVGATLERLETLGVSVVGYGTRRFPGFYLTDAGFDLDWSAATPDEVAAIVRAARAHDVHQGALVVANPLPPDEQLDPALHDRVLAEGLASLSREGITGKDVTPYLLSYFHHATEGKSLDVNVRIILRNADLAARIAAAL
ncbi:pseudouridine-5'-phosphate glycosidase [Dactylosporangium darangshiense]|uniref:pseudouridine-5'-phosphate glycosidase n=1 Tax=Dactylosporangium darangshiense TaxID=579108 RepID=UPI0031EC9C0F